MSYLDLKLVTHFKLLKCSQNLPALTEMKVHYKINKQIISRRRAKCVEHLSKVEVEKTDDFGGFE